MKILLLGEYSNVHATLEAGFRELGCKVTLVSNGDFWKDYPRDINLTRIPGKMGGMRYLLKAWSLIPRLRGYDIVQLINPMFLELKAERILPFYHFLRKNNNKLILGAYGMDYYWVNETRTRRHLRYSDFNIGDRLRADDTAITEVNDWVGTSKEKLNTFIAKDCDGIIAGLYEYFSCYHPLFPQKTIFIPFPIHANEPTCQISEAPPYPIKIFIGISKNRSQYKGTDIMLAAAKALKEKYQKKIDLKVVEGIPFKAYTKLMNGADIILDQLYSYTPSMNSLEAMSRGIICVGGGEPENYDIIHEHQLRPIINVTPTYQSVFETLEKLILQPETISTLKRQSIAYIKRHHDYRKVAGRYIDFYQKVLESE